MSIWANVFIEKEPFNYVEFEVLPQPGDIINIGGGEITTLVVNQRIINDKSLNQGITLICSKI
jgi:hypothetical protein